jgi:hypothetical protein
MPSRYRRHPVPPEPGTKVRLRSDIVHDVIAARSPGGRPFELTVSALARHPLAVPTSPARGLPSMRCSQAA